LVKLGIVGGGAMGSALLDGVVQAGLLKPDTIFLLETNQSKRETLQTKLGINICRDLAELARQCQSIILAVKPQVLPDLLRELRPEINSDHLLISIAAGVSLAALENQIPQGRFVRVMPNTPARIRRGAAAYAIGNNITNADTVQVEAIFGCVGEVLQVKEGLMDSVTALSGSGPAYVYYFIEALIDAGVLLGLGRDQAKTLAVETVIGAAEMLKQTGEHPARLRNEVTSPGGTTAAALFELEKAGIAGTLMTAIQAAARRSADLSKPQ
jgi:pyrroline-5-carboxylate reductase